MFPGGKLFLGLRDGRALSTMAYHELGNYDEKHTFSILELVETTLTPFLLLHYHIKNLVEWEGKEVFAAVEREGKLRKHKQTPAKWLSFQQPSQPHNPTAPR